MSMWQAVSDRHDKLVKVWDSGRADAAAREEMSRLIWGRLDGALGVSLVEADPALRRAHRDAARPAGVRPDGRATSPARIAAVRAGLVPVRRAASAQHRGIGADVAGRVDVLQRRVARPRPRAPGRRGRRRARSPCSRPTPRALERDLIVAAAGMADLARDRDAAAGAARPAGGARGRAARSSPSAARREIAAPPRLAVPDLDALGAGARRRAPRSTPTAPGSSRSPRRVAFAESAYAAPLRRARGAARAGSRPRRRHRDHDGRRSAPHGPAPVRAGHGARRGHRRGAVGAGRRPVRPRRGPAADGRPRGLIQQARPEKGRR